MANPTYFSVIKTTTEKLDEVLNDIDWSSLDLNPELVKVEHVGGRDWVILIRTGSARPPETVLNITNMVSPEDFAKAVERRKSDRRGGWVR